MAARGHNSHPVHDGGTPGYFCRVSKILITGANGYTGYWFSRILVDKGERLRAMYYPPDGRPDLDHPNIELVPGDVRDRDEVDRAMVGIETVYHLAALYRPTNVPPTAFFEVNVEGTRNMVESAAQAGVRKFVHCSTIGVHGTVGRQAVNEDAPIAPDDYYQTSKWEGEKLALEIAPKLGLPLTVIRPAGIYGPRERRFLKIAQLIKKRRFIMFGSGETFYHFVHVRDLCDAFMLAAKSEGSVGRAYIIGDAHAVSVGRFVNALADALGVPRPRLRLPYALLWAAAVACEAVCRPLGISPFMHRRRAAWFVSNRTFDISRARNELGYDPKVTIEEGTREMVRSFQDAGWI